MTSVCKKLLSLICWDPILNFWIAKIGELSSFRQLSDSVIKLDF